MDSSRFGAFSRVVGGTTLLVSLAIVAVGCGSSSRTTTVLRGLDDIVVMSPAEIAAVRATMPSNVVDSSGVGSASSDDAVATSSSGAPNESESSAAATSTTIPLNQDDRPAELKLFDAYAKFKSCIEDAGETIRGNLQDPNNPAYRDPAYGQLVQTCAARSRIIDALRETSQARNELGPDEVRTRNESFKRLSDCLSKRGWTIETRVDEKGLITPSRFESPDGTLNQRDLDQCLSETGITSGR